MRIAVIDTGAGNLASVLRAFRRAAGEAGLAAAIDVTTRPEDVTAADRVVLPGQGAFAATRHGLDALPGMEEALREAVERRGRPFLGICVGMQLMAERGVEHGVWDGLGWIRGEVVAIDPADPSLKIPHMGWNDLHVERPDHPVLAGLHDGDHAYFVHSYRFACADRSTELASVDYGGPVAAVIGRDNLVGTQFHPEKSQASGLRLIANFLRWRP